MILNLALVNMDICRGGCGGISLEAADACYNPLPNRRMRQDDMTGQQRIEAILARPAAYVGEIVNIDGILLVGAFSRSQRLFRQVWIAQAKAHNPRGIRGLPIHSDSTLWHGLSRLSARHVPGYQQFRVHDAVRACVRIVKGDGAPKLELLTAAVFRQAFTLFVGEDGIRLEQAAGNQAALLSVDAIEADLPRHLNRVCHVYGTLTVKKAPAGAVPGAGKNRLHHRGRARQTADSCRCPLAFGYRLSPKRQPTRSRRQPGQFAAH